jgi:hypothetical protein
VGRLGIRALNPVTINVDTGRDTVELGLLTWASRSSLPIQFVGASSAAGASGTATSVTVSVPTGNVNDILIIGVAASAVGAASAPPPLVSTSATQLTPIDLQAQVWNCSALYYRVCQVGDPLSYTFTINVGAPLTVVAARYTNVSTTTPFRDWNTTGMLDANTTTASSLAFPALNNVQSTDMVVVFASMGRNTASSSVTTISTPTGWTSRVTQNGPISGTSYCPVTGEVFDLTGGTGTPTVTGSTGSWTVQSVALVAASNPVTDTLGTAITFVAATTAASTTSGGGNSANVTVNCPPGVTNGNVLILVAGNSSGFTSYTVPSGWTPIGWAHGSYKAGTSSLISDIAAMIWWKTASSEPSSYTITANHSAETGAAVLAYSGTRSSYPIKLHATTSSVTAGSSATATSPAPYSLPQLTADDLIVDIYVMGGDATGTATITAPSSPWTTRVLMSSTVSSDFNTAICAVDQLGASTHPTATGSQSGGWAVFTLALIGTPAALPVPLTICQAVKRAAFW